ncbi:MAG: Trk system potassium transporter TrkA [Proteobacteria bacterium]|nr:Trk system potassium transporter TrkA [Pseudomonadota bacterium]
MSVLIIGGGEIGRFIAEKLIEHEREVIIIEKDERVVDELEESIDAKIIVGNGASPRLLAEAGVAGAEMVLAVTNSDEVNLLAVALAGIQAPQARRIARIRNPEFELEEGLLQGKFNVNLLINPDREAAHAILKILDLPGSVEIMDFFDARIKLVGAMARRQSELINRPLREIKQFGEGGPCVIAAIVRNNQVLIPMGDSRIMPGDTVYFAAESDRVEESMELLGHKGERTGSIMIYGGGFIGMYLAASLEKQGVAVKIVEPDPRLCSALSRKLNKSMILNTSATDQDFLEEENIEDMDAFAAVTKDDEDNILSALLAKKKGCGISIALSHNRGYQRLIGALGIDVAVNPRQLAGNTILHFIRKGKVLHASSLMDEAEFIEAEAMPTSGIVNRPIKELKLPKGVVILSVQRGGAMMVPHGETVIEPKDRVLLIARTDAIAKIEKLLMVGMDYF